jgi:hypothetical protein
MTIVAGIITPDFTGMGSDSLAADDDIASITASPKVMKFGELIVGFSGNFRVGQQFFKYASKVTSPSLEQILENTKVEGDDWQLLAIEKGRLYEITSDKGILESIKTKGRAYGAIGSGASVALGALYVSSEDEGALMRALEASAEHCTSVRGPFKIMSL